jgi:hypothetical protein
MLDDARVLARTAPARAARARWALVLVAVGVGCAVERRGGSGIDRRSGRRGPRAEALAAYESES